MYCDECGYKNKESAKYCKKCGASLEEELNRNNPQQIEKILESEFEDSQDDKKLNKKQLLEYLNMAKELEVNKLGLENSITELHVLDKNEYTRIVKPISKKKNPQKYTSLFDIKHADIIMFFLIWAFIIMTFLFWHFIFKESFGSIFGKTIIILGALFSDQFWLSLLMSLAVCVSIIIILKLYIVIKGNAKYKVSTTQYKKECKDIDDENSSQLVIYNNQKSIIDGRIKNVSNDLKDVERTLDKFYDVDVIYPKYRNLIAITTFIEYLESGRCKSLYGYTGCYNVYEQELKQNIIIGKLDQVLVQLDQIKKVQYATFLAIEQSNALQQAFLSTCSDMLQENKRTNAMLEAQAQDEKIIKRNSEIISTITALNYINR